MTSRDDCQALKWEVYVYATAQTVALLICTSPRSYLKAFRAELAIYARRTSDRHITEGVKDQAAAPPVIVSSCGIFPAFLCGKSKQGRCSLVLALVYNVNNEHEPSADGDL